MQAHVKEALAESLDDDDLTAVLDILPEDVTDPVHLPSEKEKTPTRE